MLIGSFTKGKEHKEITWPEFDKDLANTIEYELNVKTQD